MERVIGRSRLRRRLFDPLCFVHEVRIVPNLVGSARAGPIRREGRQAVAQSRRVPVDQFLTDALKARAPGHLLEFAGGHAEGSVARIGVDLSNAFEDASQHGSPQVPQFALVLPEVGMMNEADATFGHFDSQLL